MNAIGKNSSGARRPPVVVRREQYTALSQFHRAVVDVCLERGRNEVILID